MELLSYFVKHFFLHFIPNFAVLQPIICSHLDFEVSVQFGHVNKASAFTNYECFGSLSLSNKFTVARCAIVKLICLIPRLPSWSALWWILFRCTASLRWLTTELIKLDTTCFTRRGGGSQWSDVQSTGLRRTSWQGGQDCMPWTGSPSSFCVHTLHTLICD